MGRYRSVMEEAASTRFAGRLSAFMYLLSSGMLVLAELVLPNSPGANQAGLVVVAGAAFVVGLIIAVLPWARWPLWTSLLLLLPTFLLIGLNNCLADVDGYRYAPFFFVTFAWIGLTQPRWTSVAIVPMAAAAYLIPLAVADQWTPVTVSSALYVLPGCVLVGEAIAWVSDRLRRSQATVRERERSVLKLFSENPQPMWVFHAETLRFLEVNAAAVAHYGYTRDEFLAMSVTEVRVDEDPNGEAPEL